MNRIRTSWTWHKLVAMACCCLATLPIGSSLADDPDSAELFGKEFAQLDSLATGQWWNKKPPRQNPPPSMDVPRDQIVAFALYTFDRGVLKLTAQLMPLKADEARETILEFERDGQWQVAKTAPVLYPGWSSHFRIEPW